MDSDEAAPRPFTEKEKALLQALTDHHVPFLIVGMGAAIIQGVPGVTQDLDLWIKSYDDPRFLAALAEVGASYVAPWILNPPQLAGEGLGGIDLVNSPDGLGKFEDESMGAVEKNVDGIVLKMLSLERIIQSKEAAGRPKDKAALPILYATLAVLKDNQ